MIRFKKARIKVLSGGAADEYAYISFPSLYSNKYAELLGEIINYPLTKYKEDAWAEVDHTTWNDIRNLLISTFEDTFTPFVTRKDSVNVTTSIRLKEKVVFRNELGELMIFIELNANEVDKWWPADCNAAMFKEYGKRKHWDIYDGVSLKDGAEVKVLLAKLINLYNNDHPELTDDLIQIRKALFSGEQVETPPDPFLVTALQSALNEYDHWFEEPKDYRFFSWSLRGWNAPYKDSKSFNKAVRENYDRIMNLNF